ncbi:TonB family protein [Rhodohalobacter sp. SW132]|uniref:TonB family protein n=1 Tax=Rhodohalobacter sp. SW132 TaxID=2293433 RepID=UPI000E24373B|nr:TonB family protein [Rhodohalobacter sp. SW132]
MRQSVFFSVVLSLFLLSCGGPKVAIQYQGTSPIPYDNPNEESNESQSDSDTYNPDPYVMVFSIPNLKGGNSGLRKRIHYPEEAIQNEVQGIVTVQFRIHENGDTSGFVVLEGIGHGCDEAVIDAIKESTFTLDNSENEPFASFLWMVRTEFIL